MHNMLSYEQPLPRKLVHKWSPEQILLTDCIQTAEDEFYLGAILPRTHVLYCENYLHGYEADIQCLVEICRQACFVTAHHYYDVPVSEPSFQFLFQRLNARIHSFLPKSCTPESPVTNPVELVVKCCVVNKRKRGSNYSGLNWTFSVFDAAGGEVMATIEIGQTWVEKGLWLNYRDIMRRDRELPQKNLLPTPAASEVSPLRVNRKDIRNILIHRARREAGVFVADLQADARHPGFFDHAIDHIYAMVQLEASRQFAFFMLTDDPSYAADDYVITGCISEYLSVAEFDVPVTLTGRRTGHSEHIEFSVSMTQQNRKVSEFTLIMIEKRISYENSRAS
ncbi:AfsA-related hotdog domain-containing protein [Pantoea ananatis]|uniref:AfsA-related hotdog domain-containing protein n=1 Tax=Pantoea ananas TaxID=553 RepID=UPI0002323562|nr:AfsA-related hotdog domain-containing protein [Pantoea ananatis]AER34308.1 putative gamma-butyrolactone biosynthesis protein [Pantoea ananatis PA13]ASN13860.1 gamma-butyrolactone biosynthesis protein [Pantoea ananatis]KGL54255.1 gamma-butyrolactone biosynthesis protein [Pantoea ananatis]